MAIAIRTLRKLPQDRDQATLAVVVNGRVVHAKFLRHPNGNLSGPMLHFLGYEPPPDDVRNEVHRRACRWRDEHAAEIQALLSHR